VRGGFPSNNLLTELLPLGKTLIHFDTDDVNNPIFGFGENVVDNVYDDEQAYSFTNRSKRCIQLIGT
jgi:hypothetical protein